MGRGRMRGIVMPFVWQPTLEGCTASRSMQKGPVGDYLDGSLQADLDVR
jgi:hypothetical protein